MTYKGEEITMSSFGEDLIDAMEEAVCYAAGK